MICPVADIQKKIEEVKKLLFSNEEIKSAFRDPIEDGNIEKTLIHVFNQGIEDNDVIIICGSFFIMADVREFLKFDDESDFKDVNKVVVE